MRDWNAEEDIKKAKKWAEDCNQFKTLWGIETLNFFQIQFINLSRIAINLKPYEGLKPKKNMADYQPGILQSI